mgnify:CR=1 FL=1
MARAGAGHARAGGRLARRGLGLCFGQEMDWLQMRERDRERESENVALVLLLLLRPTIIGFCMLNQNHTDNHDDIYKYIFWNGSLHWATLYYTILKYVIFDHVIVYDKP